MVVFIILHYVALEMTIECVESIKKSFDQIDYRVIIVDNASNNNSGDILLSRYKENPNIQVLINKENLGFANGNNVGWNYMKENFNPDFAIILNNDVLIKDLTFYEKISRLYSETKFDILGPDIYVSKNSLHQNPKLLHGMTLDDIKRMITEYEKRLKYFRAYYLYDKTRKLAEQLIRTVIGMKPRHKMSEYIKMDVLENPVLHGACYIVSKHFIENEKFMFNPNTFMYMEEEILYYYCQKNNYKTVYSSRLMVEHLDDVSTNSFFERDYDKALMKTKEMLKSAYVFLDLMER